MNLSERRNPVTAAVALAVAAPALFAVTLGAQEPLERERVLSGVVIDELTGEPVPGAAVLIEGHRGGTLTDSLGHFTLRGFAAGPQELNVRQFGYLEIIATVVPPQLPDVLVEIPLAPAPIRLDGVTAVVEHIETMQQRMESRRRATPLAVNTFGQERLLSSGAPSVLEFLLRSPFIHPVPCQSTGFCVYRRGRVISPRVFIDEMPAFGGFEELASYNPQNIYALEIYSRGLQIRAYTYQFMERMARRPVALIPVIFE
jgi:hypothetical protein